MENEVTFLNILVSFIPVIMVMIPVMLLTRVYKKNYLAHFEYHKNFMGVAEEHNAQLQRIADALEKIEQRK